MISWAEKILDYGIAGVALLMMYSITYNHLTAIQTTLTRIETILENIRDKS